MTKLARTAQTTAEIPGLIDEALHAAVERARPGRRSSTSRSTRSSWSRTADADAPAVAARSAARCPAADGDALDRAAELLRAREQAGGDGRAPASTGRAASRRSCGSARSCRCPCS